MSRNSFTYGLLFLLLFCVLARTASAHEVRPALLEITRAAEICEVHWRQPAVGDAGVVLRPRISGGWIDRDADRVTRDVTQLNKYWSQSGCSIAALEGQDVFVEGLEATITDVVVRVDYGDGDARHTVLRPGQERLSLERGGRDAIGLSAYLGVGIEHILSGVDHLAFVLGLVLIVGLRRRLIWAVTGFTIGHSITLGLTSLGVVAVESAIIEALVALSIVFIAAEALRVRGSQVSSRWPVGIAIGFGLLHGFAFAGALSEIGLPENEKIGALLLFNLGVEIGQLLFVALLFLIAFLCKPIAQRVSAFPDHFLPYVLGCFSGYWFVERALFAL